MVIRAVSTKFNTLAPPPHWRVVGELGAVDVLQQIAAQSVKGGVHVGVAGSLNFDIACAMKSNAIVLLDINPNPAAMWQAVFYIVKNNDRLAAKRKIHKMFKESFAYNKPMRLEQQPHEGAACSWLGSDENYAHIQRLLQEDKIKAQVVDLTNVAAVDKIVQDSCRDVGAVLTSLYLSNVQRFVTPSKSTGGLHKGNQHNPAETALNNYCQSVRTALMHAASDCLVIDTQPEQALNRIVLRSRPDMLTRLEATQSTLQSSQPPVFKT